ncbi:MAG TPA: cation:proton antiporter [Dehalococcoidia bacterium]
MTAEEILLRLAGILAAGVGAQWLAWRLRFPSILLLLVAGFILGPVTEFVDPDELLGDLLLPLVSVAVAVILFEGGLSLRVRDLLDIGGVVPRLVTIGAAITGFLGALGAHLIIGLDEGVAILAGAILVVTGPTVIVPMLEQIRPIGRVSTILRWEGIVIDPIGATVAVLVFEGVVVGDLGGASSLAIEGIAKTLGAGILIGGGAGFALALLLGRYWIPDSLQNAVTLTFVVGVTTICDTIQDESGLLAAVVMGVVLANQRLATVRHIIYFKENIRVLLLAGLFVVLAARLSFDDIEAVGFEGLIFIALMIVVVRPLSVFASSAGSALSWQERLFLSGVAPRGVVAASVASIFAIGLAEEGIGDANKLVPLVFGTVVGTVAVYGVLSPLLARRLGLARPNPQGIVIVGAHDWAREIARVLADNDVSVLLVDSNRPNATAARLAGLDATSANILGEETIHELDLSEKGRILAMTPNDEVNTLAVQHFIEHFGRAEVYQLAPKGDVENEKRSVPREQRGRLLFDTALTYQRLDEAFKAGATVKATQLSEQFTLEDLAAHHGQVVPLFLVSPTGAVSVFATDKRPPGRPGQIVISLTMPPESAIEEPARSDR